MKLGVLTAVGVVIALTPDGGAAETGESAYQDCD
jgi:hypothetical protein